MSETDYILICIILILALDGSFTYALMRKSKTNKTR